MTELQRAEHATLLRQAIGLSQHKYKSDTLNFIRSVVVYLSSYPPIETKKDS